MNKTIYHVSKIPDLEVLQPKLCSHEKAYVYASYKIETALLFGGGLWSDWNFIYKRNYDTDELTFSETYAGVFDETFAGKTCYLYEVEDSGFKEGQTHMWDEIVSENPTKVLKCTKILNLKTELFKLQEKGKLKIETYQNTDEYNFKVKKHILNLAQYSDINRQINTPELLKYFGNLLEK